MNFYPGNIAKHKAFISFHNADEAHKGSFEMQYGQNFNGFVSKAVQDGDINPNENTERIYQKIRDDFIADATVTIVLIGRGTWRRKYVDWEIASSLRDTRNNSRTGLIGILLPTYSHNIPGFPQTPHKKTENNSYYSPYNIPPRLFDNIGNGFAKIYSYPNNPYDLMTWIDEAYKRRESVTPNNSRDSFSNNRPETQSYWID